MYACVAALVMGVGLVLLIGCDGKKTASVKESLDPVEESIDQLRERANNLFASMVAGIKPSPAEIKAVTGSMERSLRGMERQDREKFDNATVLEQAYGELSVAEEIRNKLVAVADQFQRDSRAALLRIESLEKEKAKAIKGYTDLRDAARAVGLPDWDVKEPMMPEAAKTIELRVGEGILTAEGIYRALDRYREQRDKADDDIAKKAKESKEDAEQERIIRLSVFDWDNQIITLRDEIKTNIRTRVPHTTVTPTGSSGNAMETSNKILESLEEDTARRRADMGIIERATESGNWERMRSRLNSPPMTDNDIR